MPCKGPASSRSCKIPFSLSGQVAFELYVHVVFYIQDQVLPHIPSCQELHPSHALSQTSTPSFLKHYDFPEQENKLFSPSFFSSIETLVMTSTMAAIVHKLYSFFICFFIHGCGCCLHERFNVLCRIIPFYLC